MRRDETKRDMTKGLKTGKKMGHFHFHFYHHIIDHALHTGLGRSHLVQSSSLSPSATG